MRILVTGVSGFAGAALVPRLLADGHELRGFARDPARVRVDLPVVRGDADRLRQVLSNLIDNAVKYSPDGEPVEVRARTENGSVVVDVSDHGPGIPPDERPLIFEKFGRAPSGGAKPGTGLGLYIARSIAEAHGGSLEVADAPGRGATFTLALPASGS
jgi:signal transduction histidine kinase